MFVDSHCHLNRLDLTAFGGDLSKALSEARAVGVEHFLCVSVEPKDVSVLYALAESYSDVSISVGVHPDHPTEDTLSFDALLAAAQHHACVAIGETGLDFYRVTERDAQRAQEERFTTHIDVARALQKPLIIHTRAAPEATIAHMRAAGAASVGGVMHCFTESYEIAKQAMDLNSYISLSGIVTFKNANIVQELAVRVPLNRLLIETDAPYLAPVPFRGKSNHPAWVKYVAEQIASLRGISVEVLAEATTANFYRCFGRRAEQ